MREHWRRMQEGMLGNREVECGVNTLLWNCVGKETAGVAGARHRMRWQCGQGGTKRSVGRMVRRDGNGKVQE